MNVTVSRELERVIKKVDNDLLETSRIRLDDGWHVSINVGCEVNPVEVRCLAKHVDDAAQHFLQVKLIDV